MRWFSKLFYILASLVVVQSIWWAYLIVSQQDQIAKLQGDPESLAKAQSYGNMMIWESAFFLFVWLISFYWVYRSYKSEQRNLKNKEDFRNAVTHELKTPISSIQLCLETLERPALNENSRKIYIERAKEATENLNQLVEQILQSKEDLPSKNQEVDVGTLIRETLDKHQKLESFHILVQGEPMVCNLAKEDLQMILNSLLDNAIKYSLANQKPSIQIEWQKQEAELRLQIKDNGIGFLPEEKEQLFKEYWRSDLSIEKAIPGTGLGLSLAKKLALRNNYQIDISSPGIDQGCQSTLVIPLSEEQSA